MLSEERLDGPPSYTEGMRAIGLAGLLCLAAAPQDSPDFPDGVFPSDNPWNWDISNTTTFPTHSNSGNIIAQIGGLTPIREDYAFPYSVVQNGQADVKVKFDEYPDESDPGPLEGTFLADGTLSTASSLILLPSESV